MRKLIPIIFAIFTINLAYALPPLSPLTTNTIEVNHIKIHYYKFGNTGVPLILLTGYATTSNFWNIDFIKCLADNHTVYLLDYPSINGSESLTQALTINNMANTVNAFTKTLKLNNTNLIGWSMGGGIAIEAGFIEPKLYKHLWLLSPIVPSNENIDIISKKDKVVLNTPEQILNYVFGNNLYNFESSQLRSLTNQFILSPTNIGNLFPTTEINNQQRVAITNWVSDKNNLTKFKQLKIPTTFFIPDHDTILNQAIITKTVEMNKQFTIITIKNSGHAVSWQNPNMVCQNIK